MADRRMLGGDPGAAQQVVRDLVRAATPRAFSKRRLYLDPSELVSV